MKANWRRLEVWFKFFLLAFFIFLFLLAIPYPQDSKKFPELIALFSLIMLGVSLVLDFTGKETAVREITDPGDGQLRGTDENTKKERRKRSYQTWGIILSSTAVGFWGGFLFSTFLLFLGFALFLGRRKDFLKNAAIAVFTTGIIYLIFEWMMGVPLIEK
jgi:hypothetical protein